MSGTGAAVPTRRQRIDRWVARISIVLAILGSAAIVVTAVVLISGRDDAETDASVPPTVTVAPITIPLATTTTPPTSTTSTTTTLPPETTTTAAPETTPPVATPAPTTTNVADIPAVPVNPVYSGLGAHQVMSDPLPSGLPYAQVEPAWITAKRLADLFPPQDWATARSILTQQQGVTDQDFAAMFGPIERMSLFLLDAVPQGNGYYLTLGVLTNTPAKSTTAIWCTHWYADTSNAIINGVTELHRYPGFDIMPEELRQNQGDVDALRAECV